MAQGIENVVSAVDTCLVQNNGGNDQQERALEQICTSLASLNSAVEQNINDTQQININYTLLEKRREEKDEKLKLEFGKGIDSLARQRASRIDEGLGGANQWFPWGLRLRWKVRLSLEYLQD